MKIRETRGGFLLLIILNFQQKDIYFYISTDIPLVFFFPLPFFFEMQTE
jgi:hypothetical protein